MCVCVNVNVCRVTRFLALEKQSSWQRVGGGSPGPGLAKASSFSPALKQVTEFIRMWFVSRIIGSHPVFAFYNSQHKIKVKKKFLFPIDNIKTACGVTSPGSGSPCSY